MIAAACFEPAGLVPQVVRERRFLQPGQLLVTTRPTAITTILGSCVAVCLWDSGRHVGGMNHYMLSYPSAGAAASPRFGSFALGELLSQMGAAGARLPFLRARVFGGACMFPGMKSSNHLGTQNADMALEFLTRRGIEIVQVATGGDRGRKVIFFTDEGSACLNSI
ncbi:MAG: cheD [Acidobacteria bacterium]|nr:cheD [Acidobacteriota bacterium]